MNTEGKLCRYCMRLVDEGADSCPACGYDGAAENDAGLLKIGTKLFSNWIVVGGCFECDGESASYYAYDKQNGGRRVVLKEYLPKGICRRDGDRISSAIGSEIFYKTTLMDYGDLYRALKKLSQIPGLIKVHDVFDENGTCYASLDAFEGITLREFLNLKGGEITFRQAEIIFDPIFEAVEAMHKLNLTHRGISPETIYLNRAGDIKLGGYATTSLRTKGSELVAELKSGYAAPEQYSPSDWQGSWTDVYALSATLYRCLTGTMPQESEQRRSYDNLLDPSELNAVIPKHVARAMMKGMEIDTGERIQTASMLEELLQNPNVRFTRDKTGEVRVKRVSSAPSGRWIIGVLAGFVATAVIVAVSWQYISDFLFGASDPPPDDPNAPISDTEPETLTAPNYVGEVYEELEANGGLSKDFSFITEMHYSDIVAEGVIIDQTPEEGATMEKGDTIRLLVSAGPNKVDVPDVVGWSEADAIARFKYLKIPYLILTTTDANYAAGVVIRTDPVAGTEVTVEKTQVTIWVSR